MQAHRYSCWLSTSTQSLGKAKASQENTIYLFTCNTQQVLITLLFQLIRMPLMPQWLWAHLPTLIFSHLFKSLPRQCLFVQPQTVFQIGTGSFLPEYEMNSQSWPRIWISDTNCSEKREEWMFSLSLDKIHIIWYPRTHPCTNWCRFTYPGEKIQGLRFPT